MHTPGSCLALTCITFFCACLHVFKGVVDATQVPWNIYSMEDAESSMIVQLYTRHVVLVPKCSNTPKCWYESQKKIYNIFSLTLLALPSPGCIFEHNCDVNLAPAEGLYQACCSHWRWQSEPSEAQRSEFTVQILHHQTVGISSSYSSQIIAWYLTDMYIYIYIYTLDS